MGYGALFMAVAPVLATDLDPLGMTLVNLPPLLVQEVWKGVGAGWVADPAHVAAMTDKQFDSLAAAVPRVLDASPEIPPGYMGWAWMDDESVPGTFAQLLASGRGTMGVDPAAYDPRARRYHETISKSARAARPGAYWIEFNAVPALRDAWDSVESASRVRGDNDAARWMTALYEGAGVCCYAAAGDSLPTVRSYARDNLIEARRMGFRQVFAFVRPTEWADAWKMQCDAAMRTPGVGAHLAVWEGVDADAASKAAFAQKWSGTYGPQLKAASLLA